MIQILAVLCGIVIAIMIPLNGKLTAEYGTFLAAVIVHVVGTALSATLCFLHPKGQNSLWQQHPWWIYSGGAIGVLTTVFNALAYGKISMTSIVALGLLGQSLTSLTIDFMGLSGHKKQPIQKSFLLMIGFAGVGIAVMLDNSAKSAAISAILSICAGVSVVVSRMLNASLSEKIGSLQCSFVNHAVGLGVTAALSSISILKSGFPAPSVGVLRPWIYCGGALGVICVIINNIIVPQMSAFQLTIITFSSQILVGVAFDLILENEYSKTALYGGVIVAFGILLGTILNHFDAVRLRRERDYYARIESVENEHKRTLLEKYEGKK